MNIFKKRISLILSVVMLAVAILPVFIVSATTAGIADIEVTIDGKTLKVGDSYEVEGGEEITVTATCADKTVDRIAYYYADASKDMKVITGSTTSFTAPTGEEGTTRTLKVAASVEGKVQSWHSYVLDYAVKEVVEPTVKLKYNSKTIENLATALIKPGASLSIVATPESSIKSIQYKWNDESWMNIEGATSEVINVPAEYVNGTVQKLYIRAVKVDGTKTSAQVYILVMQDGVPQVSLVAKLGSTEMSEGNTYEVEGGEVVSVVAKSTVADVAWIAYYYTENGKKSETQRVEGATASITVPTGDAGSTKTLYIEAIGSNDNINNVDPDGTITKTKWIPFVLKYKDAPVDEPDVPVTPENKEVNVAYEGKVLTPNSTTEVNPGESLKITAEPADKILNLYFKWDSDAWQKVASTSDYPTRVPTSFKPGSTHWLYVKAEYTDGTTANERAYKFVIPEEASEITMNVKLESKTITPGKTYEVKGGEEVVVSASCTESDIDYIRYRFGTDDAEKENGSKAEFEVPDKKVGTTLKLYVEAVAEDGSKTGEKVYILKFVDTVSGKLDVEPWMEENDELVELAINLRNDSEEDDKANKNIYELDEVVTYFIDYKNGTGDDIDSKVTIEFEVPIEFEVVSMGDGKLDKDDSLITWEFPNGLEEDEAGTLVVKLKYVGFSKSKYDSETIYPSAAIYKGKKEADRSTVINLVVEEYGMEIDEVHEPYMYGDANKNTFRPDANITRAEGALVLARIYGLDYQKVNVTPVFSDLDDTYLEAQKAIIAATKAGLVNGYTNGTFKPNAKMTRAEFMKILACMVEMNATDEEIEGLEVKDVENNIKVYADSTRYYIVDGKKVYSHWAIEEVSLLARLNMTPLSDDEDEIELDEEITRAEVAQLVNFYLLRAPASVTSKTKSGFSDVSKKHDLFADIIEATREEHTYSIDESDGTEVAE